MHALVLLAADDNANAAGGLIQIGILLLIPLAMYFLMIRPQRRRMREQQSMQRSLDVGDEVMTNSGVYGWITAFEDDIAWIEVDDDVQIRVNRSFLQGKVNTSAEASAPSPSPSPTAESGRVTPTVKGVKGAPAAKGVKGAPASVQATDADAAERTTTE